MVAVARRSEDANAYQRRRPEDTALYEIVRDNLETLYGAIDDGALDVRIPKHARKELEGFLECGLLCRGFARLYCATCKHSQLVAFSCKGRGFWPSCLGRRMCATAANLVERVLPDVDLRQWVLTFPFAWRRRLAQDGALLGTLTRLFVATVQRFYAERTAARSGVSRHDARSGAVTVVQRTSSDLRLNPHLHVVFLDGAYHEQDAQLAWQPLGHLQTREVGHVLQRVVQRMDKYLRRHGLLDNLDPDAEPQDAEEHLAASAVSGQAPPAGPQWRRVKYAGVLAPASPWRPRIKPQPEPIAQPGPPPEDDPLHARGTPYRAWAELLKRTFDIDVLECAKCHGPMKLIALVIDLHSAARYLAKIGEPTELPARSNSRGPPYWKSTVLRRKAGA